MWSDTIAVSLSLFITNLLGFPYPLAGKGAYGTVYKALDRTNGTSVAIKVIPLTEQDKEDFKQIQREIAFLADCNHPNVVRYLVRQSPSPLLSACPASFLYRKDDGSENPSSLVKNLWCTISRSTGCLNRSSWCPHISAAAYLQPPSRHTLGIWFSACACCQ